MSNRDGGDGILIIVGGGGVMGLVAAHSWIIKAACCLAALLP